MAGFVSPEMQAKMSATNSGGSGGYTAPGVGGAGSSPGAPPQFNPAALMQYMGGMQQPSAATSFAGPARYGQPTGWNQQMQAQRPPMAASGGNPFQLPGAGTTGQPATTGSGGSSAPVQTAAPRYGQPGYGMPFNPGSFNPVGNMANNGQQSSTPSPAGRDPRSVGAMPMGQNMASQVNAYQQARPQQSGGTPWQPPINPNGVYSPSNMQQNMEQMRAAMAFRNSGQAMPQGNYVNGNPGMGLYGFSGY